MRVLLAINALVELLAGLLLLFAPELMPELEGANSLAFVLIRMYAVAAISIGILSVYGYMEIQNIEAVRIICRSLIPFHVGISAVGFFGYNTGVFTNPGISLLHGLLAVAFIYFYFQHRFENIE